MHMMIWNDIVCICRVDRWKYRMAWHCRLGGRRRYVVFKWDCNSFCLSLFFENSFDSLPIKKCLSFAVNFPHVHFFHWLISLVELICEIFWIEECWESQKWYACWTWGGLIVNAISAMATEQYENQIINYDESESHYYHSPNSFSFVSLSSVQAFKSIQTIGWTNTLTLVAMRIRKCIYFSGKPYHQIRSSVKRNLLTDALNDDLSESVSLSVGQLCCAVLCYAILIYMVLKTGRCCNIAIKND